MQFHIETKPLRTGAIAPSNSAPTPATPHLCLIINYGQGIKAQYPVESRGQAIALYKTIADAEAAIG